MTGKSTILVTGANTGLGFEIVKALCRSEKVYNIILGGRSLEKVQTAVRNAQDANQNTKSTLSPIQINLEDDESIKKCFEEVSNKFGTLDALVNNAGAQYDPDLAAGRMDMRQMWNKSWDVNTTGTQIVTSTFIPLLLKSSDPRLLFITSGTSGLAGTSDSSLAINKSPPKGWPKSSFNVAAYRSAKAGMNMMMREWVRILKEDGVKVFCIAPGLLATGLGGNPEVLKKLGAEDPALGGEFVKDVLEGQRDSDVGKVILRSGIQPW